MDARLLRFAAIPLGAAMALGAVVAVATSGPDGGTGLAQGLPTVAPTSSSASPSPSASDSPTPTATVVPTSAPPTTAAPTTPAPKPVRCGTLAHSPMSDGVISGTVVDSAGRPLSGLAVYSPPACGGHEPRTGVNRTDAQGRFALPCSSKAPSWVVVSPFEWWTRKPVTSAPVAFGWLTKPYVTVPCGTSYDVTLPPAGTIRAQLVDSAGKPVTRTYSFGIFIGETERSSTGSGEGIGVVAPDAQGVMTIPNLAAGPYVLLSSGTSPPGDPATEMRAVVRVTAGKTTTVQIVVNDEASPSPTPTITTGSSLPVVG